MGEHIVIFGGQYGSEGKASAAEHFARRIKDRGEHLLIIGENSPNSGHTSSKGATKNIPASSFWADAVMLGPDAVIDADVLIHDWETVGKPPLYVHEHAALLDPNLKAEERDLVSRISSTGSGSGMARSQKFIHRQAGAVVRGHQFPEGIQIVPTLEYRSLVAQAYSKGSMLLECSQGAMLDTNFGVFPFVTSRSTLPRVAVERNGLGWVPWLYAGVYRMYPIRTGGPSGPTGGAELQWEQIGVPPEIATVTKRKRRIFEFSTKDFCQSISLARPDIVMFTFLDYIGVDDLNDLGPFREWLEFHDISEVRRLQVWVSNKTGVFRRFC